MTTKKEDWESKYAAPKGTVWVCAACGKRAKNQATGGIDKGWDESCFLNSVLCDDKEIKLENGRVVECREVKR